MMSPPTYANNVARKFTTANPIDFDFYNQDDERVVFITEDETQLQTLNLELRNASPHNIEFQTPDSKLRPKDTNGHELEWGQWMASKDCFHFQLSFRPGVLSEKAKRYLNHPGVRLAFLDNGWDLKYDPDATDQTDWVSFLWVDESAAGKLESSDSLLTGLRAVWLKAQADPPADLEQIRKEVGQRLDSLPDLQCARLQKNGVAFKLPLPKISAGTGGGARGTRVHLKYQHLLDQERAAFVPDGTRTLFLNIVNHQGKQYIPLHVGFVGSNTILNDGGITENELRLRITNTSPNPIAFGRRSVSAASRFSLSVDVEQDGKNKQWALTSAPFSEDIQLTKELARKAISFNHGDQTADYIDVKAGYLYQKQNWTLSAWVLPIQGKGSGVIYEEKSDQTRANVFQIQVTATGNLGIGIRTHYQGPNLRWAYVSGPELVFDQWNFVWITFSEGRLSIRANEKLLNDTIRVGRPVTANSATIGRGIFHSSHFHGHVGSLSLWGKACSDDQIGFIKSSGCLGDETGLLSYWPMNAIEDRKVKNLKTGACDGEVRGNPTPGIAIASTFTPNRATWAFDCNDVVGDQLAGGESFNLKLTHIRSASPTGYANLYFHYEDIPGFWDGQIVCLIEKSPLVYRRGNVGIGTDMEPSKYDGQPSPKLHVDVGHDNSSRAAGEKKPAAVFEGGNVGIGTRHPKSRLAVTDGLAIGDTSWVESNSAPLNGLLVEGNVGIGGKASGKARLEVRGATSDAKASALDLSDSSGKLLFTLRNDGNLGIGTDKPASKLAVAGGMAVGDNYTAIQDVPPNGMLVEGNVGIGSNIKPTVKLHVASTDQYVAHFKSTSAQDAGIIVETTGTGEAFIEFRKKKVTVADADNSNAWMFGIDDDHALRIARVSGEEDSTTPVSPYALDIRAPVTNQNYRKHVTLSEPSTHVRSGKHELYKCSFTLACNADVLFLASFDKLYSHWKSEHVIKMLLDYGRAEHFLSQIDVSTYQYHGGDSVHFSPSMHYLKTGLSKGEHTFRFVTNQPVKKASDGISSFSFDKGHLSIIQL